ncbi:hypothetical protein TRICI_006174 [Trichomonascus ciferrii]|uniref:CFEM domain-containing protein n=1 Tax=Trichomonascus ciferrii TaxID=44093 RepID=A0A642UKB3_9ASCO|nr:hypothetical protein TRICI_006174 [Trichomonascus ciferrii]
MKFSTALLTAVGAAGLVSATTPACVLACVAEVSRKADCDNDLANISCLCDKAGGDIKSCLKSKCGDLVDDATSSVESSCKAQGANLNENAKASSSSSAASATSSSSSNNGTSSAAEATSTSAAAGNSTVAVSTSSAPVTATQGAVTTAGSSSAGASEVASTAGGASATAASSSSSPEEVASSSAAAASAATSAVDQTNSAAGLALSPLALVAAVAYIL